MQTAESGRSTYIRKLFLFNHGAGLVAGACFPLVAYAMLGDKALTPAFFLVCLFAGFVFGAASFWFVRQTLKKQLREQLVMLHELLGEDVERTNG
jgi:methyl-accepting chemotaxis protein